MQHGPIVLGGDGADLGLDLDAAASQYPNIVLLVVLLGELLTRNAGRRS